MKLKKFSAAALAALTVTMMSAAPVLAADDIDVNEDISVSGDYDWKRFANDHITLNVYNNGLYISDGSDESINVLSAFEELTGIKVNYTTYDSNESLYAKLKSGGVSYDVIFPSDYMVGKMAKEGMLSELNMDNIPNFAGIGETYLDRSFDPGNKYSVPYMWGTTGLIYNTTMVEEPPTKWADMWDVAYTNNVLMFNNSRDAYAIAAKTIGLSMNPQSVDEITAITDALKNKTTRAAIQEALNGSITVNGVNVPIRNYIVDGNISDGCTAWGVHNGTYTVPAGQYVSRFFFVAVASASGDSEEGLKRGNLIDRVWFSTDPVPPAAGSGILRVTKTLLKTDGTALTDAELIQAKENLHFTVVNSDRQIVGDFSGSAMQADSINPNVLQYTLELPLTDSNGNTYNYAVTETARGEPTGYDCTLVRTVKDGGVWTDVTDTPIHSGIALTAQAATNIQFENTYARATGSLTITKQLPDDADDALQADFAETVNTFTIASVAAGSYTPQYSADARPADAPAAVSPDSNGRLTLTIKGAGSVTLPGLAPASYTVTESAAPDLTNYYLTTPTADRTQSLDVTAGGTVEAHFTNTYEPYLSVTITKKVVGDMGDTTKNFSFTATLDTTQIRQGSAYTTAGDGAALTDTGFTLRSGGSVTLTHLRADQNLTLTETDPGDHTVSWQLNGDDGPTGVTCTLQVPRAQPAEITCINTRNVGIPTGLHTGAAPYLALVGLCWLGWRLLRRREV